MTLGDRIKEVRSELSQREFGKIFGVTADTLRRYETNKNPPDAGFLTALVKHYGVDPSWLLMGEGAKYKEEAGVQEAAQREGACTDPRCVGALHADGHLLSKAPPFDAELLSHIFNELHAYKASFPDRLSEKQELDVISLASVFLQPDNREEAALICSIVEKWINAKKTVGNFRGTLKNFGTVTKVDLLSNEERGIIEIDYGSAEILQLLRIAFDQLPEKTPSIKKAKETVFGGIIGNINIAITGYPVLNKKVLKSNRKYLITDTE